MANRYAPPVPTALDSTGDPISGATLTFYNTGTVAFANTYSDDDLTTANTNPVVADSAGRFGNIFLQAIDYKVVLKNADGVIIWTRDPVRHHLSTEVVLSTGSTTGRTLADRFADIINVLDYGAVGDGVADDTTATQAAVDAAGANNGGTVFFPAGEYLISTTLDVTNSNVSLLGDGANRVHYVFPINSVAATQLIWDGAAGGTMVDFNSPSGASNEKMFGGGVKGMDFAANGLAAYGLKVRSWNKAVFENLYFDRLTTSCIVLDVVSTLAEAKDTQQNRFVNITGRTDPGTGDFINLNGDAAANSSFNLFMQCACDHKDGDVFVLNNSDNNLFIQSRVLRGAGGAGNAIVFNGSDDGAQRVARHNIFIHHTGVGGIIGRGTESFTHPSFDNHVLLADKSNSTPDPTEETGASVHYSDTNGYIRFAVQTNANRGAAGLEGRIIFNSDDGQLNVDDGTNWTLPDGTTT